MVKCRLFIQNFTGSILSGREIARPCFAEYLFCSPGDIQYAEGPWGKPSIVGFSGLSIGLSHSRGILASYIGGENAGLDIEFMREKRDFTGISDAFFTASERARLEWARLERAGNEVLSFYRIWTRKESLLKLSGKGLADLGTMDSDALEIGRGVPCRYWRINGSWILCLSASESVLESIEISADGFQVSEDTGSDSPCP